MSAIPYVDQVRAAMRKIDNSKTWQKLAKEDADQLIGLIGLEQFASWTESLESDITYRDLSMAICEKVFMVLQEQDRLQLSQALKALDRPLPAGQDKP